MPLPLSIGKPEDKKTIGVVGTLDTKLSEIMFLKGYVTGQGLDAKVFDCSMLKHDNADKADVTPQAIASTAGVRFEELSTNKDRSFGTSSMARGLGIILKDLVESDQLDGVISVGGAQGTSISSSAFRELPIGFPKLIVSVIASGNIRPYVGERDIMVMFSVADINGAINRITQTVLTNAGAAIVGMAVNGTRMSPSLSHEKPIIAITTWGTTQKAVTAASDHLRSVGFEPVMFHSSGACTSAMESLVDQGMIDGVLDLTTHDLLGEIFNADIMPPTKPGRLLSAGRRGIPLVVAPGGLNMFVMGPYSELGSEYSSRPTIRHNPSITEVRLTREEIMAVAGILAERLNAAKGYCAFVMPLRGWNDYDAQGSDFYRPEENVAFLRTLRKSLRPNVEVFEVDSNLNEADVGRFAAKLLTDRLRV